MNTDMPCALPSQDDIEATDKSMRTGMTIAQNILYLNRVRQKAGLQVSMLSPCNLCMVLESAGWQIDLWYFTQQRPKSSIMDAMLPDGMS